MNNWDVSKALFFWLVAGALMVFGLMATGWANQSPASQQPTPAMTVTAGDVARAPEKYYGKRVTVRAEVEDVLGRQVFLLDEDKTATGTDLVRR